MQVCECVHMCVCACVVCTEEAKLGDLTSED